MRGRKQNETTVLTVNSKDTPIPPRVPAGLKGSQAAKWPRSPIGVRSSYIRQAPGMNPEPRLAVDDPFFLRTDPAHEVKPGDDR
jgi:hypothetical protein